MTALTARAISVTRRASALYCATYGSGAPLLLIHGFGATGADYQPLIPALATRYQVIVPDLRGHGQSRRLPLADCISRLSDDLDDLLDLLDVGPAFVMGHAAGCAVVQQLAHDRPMCTRGMILACGSARGISAARNQITSRLRGIANIVGVRSSRSGDATTTAGEHLLQRFDSRPWLRYLNIPALVVAGTADLVAPPQQARELAGCMPHAQLEVIQGAGHWMLQTHTSALLDLVLPWLAHQEGRA